MKGFALQALSGNKKAIATFRVALAFFVFEIFIAYPQFMKRLPRFLTLCTVSRSSY